MIVLAVTWMAHPTREKEVAILFQKLEAASRQEPGCLMYVVHQHVDNPKQFFIYEQYRDAAALEAHRNSPHFQELAVKGLKDIAVRLQGDLFRPLTEE